MISVALCTYNGEAFLREQLDSLATQSRPPAELQVGDDRSTDATLDILADFRSRAPFPVHVHGNERRLGYGENFIATARRCSAPWIAFCDQDDVWLAEKSQAAVAALEIFGSRPALYCARTIITDADGEEMSRSPLFRRPPDFANALVQSIGGGNTMVMNRAAAELVAASAGTKVVTHDWFTYQIVAGAGGKVHYDPTAWLRYRQHRGNVIGSNRGWRAMGNRLLRMLQGEFRNWNETNGAALAARRDSLTPEHRGVLDAFLRARAEAWPWTRLAWLRQSGVFRQPASQQAMLKVACVLRRI